jgi:hypothetical protein
MGISHVGGHRPLPIVPQQVSAPKPEAPTTDLDRSPLPETRKDLPSQAKGAANGHSIDKVFAKWDKDGDGKITAAEAGPRFGHGILGQLLKLQEAAPPPAPPVEEGDTSDTPPVNVAEGDTPPIDTPAPEGQTV